MCLHVLKEKEQHQYGEYRIRRLVLGGVREIRAALNKDV
jgi:hypothetical protein